MLAPIALTPLLGSVDLADWAFLVGPYRGDGQPDLYAVHVRNTGSGRVEVHVLGAASGYQSFLVHAATALAAVPADSWQWALVDGDLYGIFYSGTGSGRVELHVLSGATAYRRFVTHIATALPVTGPDRFDFLVGYYNRDGHPDLIAVLHRATGSGHTEVHVLSAASNYARYLLHAATPLGPTSDAVWSFGLGNYDGDGIPDLHAVRLGLLGVGTLDVHVLSGRSTYRSWIAHEATGLPPGLAAIAVH